MKTREVVLILIVVFLIFLVFSQNALLMRLKNIKQKVREYTCIDKDTGSVSEVKMTYEDQVKSANKENMIAYTSKCDGAEEANKVADCLCSGQSDYDYDLANFEYGTSGMSYSDVAASQAVDDQTLINHLQFIKDRRGVGPNGEYTGRVWSPDYDISTDQIPWRGLRFPDGRVKVCNPTEVPDINLGWYAHGNRLSPACSYSS